MKKYIATVLSVFLFFSLQNAFADDQTEVLILGELVDTLAEDVTIEGIQSKIQGYSLDQLNAIIGHYGYGDLHNTSSDLTEREWSPDSWENALQGLSGGNEERYKELVEAYKTAHPSLTESDASKGMSVTNTTDYQQQVQTNQAANVQASYAFNDTNEHLKNIKDISTKIEEADNAKSIQDLNARLNTEIAYLQVEVIKGIAVMNQQLAQQQATEIHDKTEAAKFNQIPE